VSFAELAPVFNEITNWNPGDKANYNLSVGTFLKGTMNMEVLSFDGSILALKQVMDLKVMKQDCEISLDVGTGEITKMVCNGQTQDPGAQDVEIIETRQEKVTVPAGTFDSTWVKAREKTQNTVSEQWVNPFDIPVLGMIKMKAASQMGEINAVLTSFVKK
jgi:hypothetical protein